MSSSYLGKSDSVQNSQLKMQDLRVTNKEPGLYVDNGADLTFLIGEQVARIVACKFLDDSAGTEAVKAQSTLSIVDSTAYTAGGDQKAIRVTGIASLDDGDMLTLVYITSK